MSAPTEDIPEDSYRCETCGGIFIEGRTDGKAKAKSVAIFGLIPAKDLAIVCEDCWRAMGFGE